MSQSNILGARQKIHYKLCNTHQYHRVRPIPIFTFGRHIGMTATWLNTLACLCGKTLMFYTLKPPSHDTVDCGSNATILTRLLRTGIYHPWRQLCPAHLDEITSTLTNSMEPSLSSEANSCSATEEILSILRNAKEHYVYTRAQHRPLSWAK
jgi:hypothetical protein